MRTRLPFLSRRRGLTTLLGMPGLEACFDAQIPSSVNPDSVGRVAQWNDLTGKGRHLIQAGIGSQPIYLPWSGQNYGYLPGVTGNSFSAPDSAALSFGGNFGIRAKIMLYDWTPASVNWVAAKVQNDGQSSYDFGVQPSGVLVFRYTPTGAWAAFRTAQSTVAPTVSDGATLHVRVDYITTGSVNFYTSADGVTWTQLGTTVAITAGTAFDGTDAASIGVEANGSSGPLFGAVYSVEFRGSADTVVAAFDPNRAVDGATSFVAATGETWTVNTSGGKPAQIVGRSSVLFDGVDDSLTAAGLAINQPGTIVIAFKQLAWGSKFIYDGSGTSRFTLLQSGVTPALSLFSGSTALNNSALPLNTVGVDCAVFNGANSLHSINRGAAVTGNAGNQNLSQWTLGGTPYGVDWGNIQVLGAAAFSIALDARTRARVIDFMIRKYGINA